MGPNCTYYVWLVNIGIFSPISVVKHESYYFHIYLWKKMHDGNFFVFTYYQDCHFEIYFIA